MESIPGPASKRLAGDSVLMDREYWRGWAVDSVSRADGLLSPVRMSSIAENVVAEQLLFSSFYSLFSYCYNSVMPFLYLI